MREQKPDGPQSIQDKIDDIMDRFDFGKVHAYMREGRWTWANLDMEDGKGTKVSRLPTETEIRTHARKMLEQAAKAGVSGATSYGGFVADYSNECLSLIFALEQAIAD